MRAPRRLLWALGAAALAAGVVIAWLTIESRHAEARGLSVALVLLGGWGFVGAGLMAWARRPDNRIGALMVLAGFLWFPAGLNAANSALLFSVGVMASNVFVAALFHLLLAFPDGRLERRSDRWLVVAAYLVVTVASLPLYLFSSDLSRPCEGCPDYLFLVDGAEGFQSVYEPILNTAGVLLLVATLVRVAQRWRAATRPQRRVLGPVFGAGSFTLVMLSLALGADLLGLPDGLANVVFLLGATAFVLLPWLFLGSLARSRMLSAGAVSALVAGLAEKPQPGVLRDSLARALGDDSLELAYWLAAERRWVDAAGTPTALPEPGGGRVVTPVQRDGQPVAAIVHDARDEEDTELVRAAGATAAIALENERLDAELRAKVNELRDSRARLMEAGLAERRALERNLHDGAQQRLVSLALSLKVARGRVEAGDDASASELLGSASEELDQALAELRELARGIHPAVLSDRGLGAALEALAGRSPVPVEIEGAPDGRLPGPVELTAYYVASEALTNVAKYSEASRARVAVARVNGALHVEVSDDGVGGADPSRGSGLRGLADRLRALEGRLSVESEPGAGTAVRAEIPCE